jgi:predicted enzyme related to lactoylglutathione lyase
VLNNLKKRFESGPIDWTEWMNALRKRQQDAQKNSRTEEEELPMSRVIHFEIHAADPERAIKFYQALFGWAFSRWSGEIEYWLVKTGPSEQPGIDGGLVRRRGEIDGTAVIAYVCTIDVASVDGQRVVRSNWAARSSCRNADPGCRLARLCKDTEATSSAACNRICRL